MRFFCKKNKKFTVYRLPFTVFCTQKARKIQNKFSYRHVDEQVYFTKHFVTIRGGATTIRSLWLLRYGTRCLRYGAELLRYVTCGHYDT